MKGMCMNVQLRKTVAAVGLSAVAVLVPVGVAQGAGSASASPTISAASDSGVAVPKAGRISGPYPSWDFCTSARLAFKNKYGRLPGPCYNSVSGKWYFGY